MTIPKENDIHPSSCRRRTGEKKVNLTSDVKVRATKYLQKCIPNSIMNNYRLAACRTTRRWSPRSSRAERHAQGKRRPTRDGWGRPRRKRRGLFRVREIRLANNRFTGDLTSMIENQDGLTFKLEVLDLTNNLLIMSKTEAYPDPMGRLWESLVSFFQLREFRIGGNKFDRVALPSVLRYGWPELRILDVSNNHLVGSIVEEVFDPSNQAFRSMKVLNISNNNLTLNITRLPQLITLDVSSNNLSGELPDIPVDSSLWNADFFAYNPGLCGGPLPACPSPAPPQQVIFIKKGLSKGALIAIILSSVLVPLASCVIVLWRWRVYKKLHEQDADLIATLVKRETTALMPLRELRRATDNFAESAQIGSGGFGIVYTGKLQDGTLVAIKRSKREGTEADKQQFLNEVRILSNVNHRHLVKLLICCMENKVALLVFEFVPNGTLQEHLRGEKSSRLSWKQRLQIAMQTADAVNYLHSAANHPIIHRDIKSANILLTEKLNVKVADFGISKLTHVDATHVSTLAVQGTMGYIDPEYYTSVQLTAKSDVYSFGVVLLELISAQSVIDFNRPAGDASLITFATSFIQNREVESLIDPVLMDTCTSETVESVIGVGTLALKCLQARAKDRPEMREVWAELQTLSLGYEGSGSSDFLDGTFLSGQRVVEKSTADSSALLTYSSDGGSWATVPSFKSTISSDEVQLSMTRS